MVQPYGIRPCRSALSIDDDDAQKGRQVVTEIKTGAGQPVTMHAVGAMIVGRKDHPLHRGTGNINAAILQYDSGEFRPATGK